MAKMNEISDEQLARFLVEQSPLEEAAAVEEAVCQSDEDLDDILNMVAAIELQKKTAALNPRKRIWTHWRYWSAAAVLLLIMGGVVLKMNTNSTVEMDAAPVLATQDTIDTDSVTDVELTFQY